MPPGSRPGVPGVEMGDGRETVCNALTSNSVQAAIRMIGYYEETYRRIQELIVASNIGEIQRGVAVAAGQYLHGRRCDRRGQAGRAVEALGLLCAETVVQPAESPPGEDRPRDVSQTLSRANRLHLALLHFRIVSRYRAGPGVKVQKCSVQPRLKIRAAMSEYRFHLQKYRYGSKTQLSQLR